MSFIKLKKDITAIKRHKICFDEQKKYVILIFINFPAFYAYVTSEAVIIF